MYTVYTALGGEAAGPGMIAYEMERHGCSHAAGIDFDTLSAPKKTQSKHELRWHMFLPSM